jgi:hypothetical protein
MHKKIYQWLLLFILPVVPGCFPEEPDSASDLDLVYTNYSQAFNFKAHTTFAIPDSVVKITGNVFNDPNGNGKPSFLSSDYGDAILNQVKQNMSADGWTQVDKNNSPDVVLLVSAMTTENIYYSYDWSYWDWWYPGLYPDWGWYYPGYYYPTYISGYRTGSIFIQMVDNSVAIPNGSNVPIVWNCILNGLVEANTANMNARIQSSLNTAFNQSPYLKIN